MPFPEGWDAVSWTPQLCRTASLQRRQRAVRPPTAVDEQVQDRRKLALVDARPSTTSTSGALSRRLTPEPGTLLPGHTDLEPLVPTRGSVARTRTHCTHSHALHAQPRLDRGPFFLQERVSDALTAIYAFTAIYSYDRSPFVLRFEFRRTHLPFSNPFFFRIARETRLSSST